MKPTKSEKERIYVGGWNTGYEIALTNKNEYLKMLTLDNRFDIEDKFLSDMLETESEARSYSPFEFMAREINDYGVYADELWELFDKGVVDGIKEIWLQITEEKWREKHNPPKPDAPDLYQLFKRAGILTDNHESDLYVIKNADSDRIIAQYEKISDFKLSRKMFRSAVDDKIWWDIPFMYTPWWTKKEKR